MATDFVYSAARKAFGQGQLNLLTQNVQAMLVSNQYTPAQNSDQYVSAIPSGAIIKRDVSLVSKGFSLTGGFYGTLPAFNALVSAMMVSALVLYINTGTDAASPLLYYSAGGSGFPFLPEGFDYSISYDQSSGGWFQA